MADEIKLNINLTVTNGQFKQQFQPGQLSLPQATQGYDGPVVTVNTSAEETITFGNLTTPSLVVIQSLEATTTGNFVTYGPDSTGMVALSRLSPKDIHIIRLTSTGPTLKAQADTAAVNVRFQAFEL